MKPIEWESLSQQEQMHIAAAGEDGPLPFTQIWFNITQGDAFRSNWHHHYFDWVARRILDGTFQNVVINIPPGGTKLFVIRSGPICRCLPS